MAASGKQHAGGGGGGEVFDVRVVAFAGGSAATLQALQDLFGLDREGAQRLVDNVPLIVRRAAPANEAQSFVTALRGIGAQVALERPSNENGFPTKDGQPMPLPKPPARVVKAAPPPPRAAAGKVSTRDGDALPRPIIRQATADLEFDMGSAISGAPESEPKSAMQPLGTATLGVRRNEIDFGRGSESKLELDIGSARGATSDRAGVTRTAISQPAGGVRAAVSERTASRTVSMPVPLTPSTSSTESRSEPTFGRHSRTDVSAVAGPGPMSRAAVVHPQTSATVTNPARARQIALLRVLIGVGIAALGISFDSSIIWGNANWVSVAAHAVAIYQLGVGLRELAP